MAEKKKVLIVSAQYLRSTAIASIRPRKIAKYLSATGRYDVSVITVASRSEITGKAKRKPVYMADLSVVDKDDYISEYTLVSHSNSIALYGALRKPFKLIGWGLRKMLGLKKPGKVRNIMYAFNYLDDTSFYRRAKKIIRKKKLWETDIVFSTYGPYAPHYIARYIKKKNPAVFWIANFDDPVYQKDLTALMFKTYAKGYASIICKTADVITAVSQGFLDIIDLPDVPSCVLSNGFDPDDAPVMTHSENEKFTLAYTGTIYKNRQSKSMATLFHAIRELIDEGAVDEGKIKIEYAGSNGSVLTKQAKRIGLQSIIYSHGLVNRDRALEIQKNSNILLVASWNVEGYTGWLTGKIYEYMMMEKPVVTIVAGDIPNSEIKELTDRCALGFCYEEACHERDYVLLKDYIYNQYRHFIEHGTVLFEPNTREIDKYSYPSIVEGLEKLFKR